MYDRDVANLFVPELLDLYSDFMEPAPKPSVEAEAESAVAVLDPELAIAAPAEVAQTSLSLGRLSLEHRADRALADGTATLDVLAPLRARYNLPSPDDVVHGAVVAVAEPGEDVSHVNTDTIAADRRATIKEMAKTSLDSFSMDTDTVGQRLLGVADQAAQLLKPVGADQAQLGAILKRNFPDDAVIGENAYTNVGVALLRVRDLLLSGSMSVDEARLKIVGIQAGVQEAASFGYFSGAQAHSMLSSVFGPILEADDPDKFSDTTTANIETFASAAEAAVGIGAAARVVKAGVQAGRALKGVGLFKGTMAAVVAQTRAGYEGLVALVRSRASNAPEAVVTNATRTEDIIDGVALPKVDGRDITRMPYIEATLVDDAERAKLLTDPAYVFGAASVKRINGMVASEVKDGGVTMTASFGTRLGAAYRNAAVAQRANARDFGGAGKVVQDGNGWFIQVERSREFGLDDAAKQSDLTMPGTALGRMLSSLGGKMLYTTKFGAVSSNTAVRATEKAESALAELAKPYLSLPAGSQRRVAKALDYADEQSLDLSIHDLRGAFGLNDKEIVGYASIRRTADVALDLDNTRLWHKFTQAGWKGIYLNGRGYGIKPLGSVDEAVLLEQGIPAKNIKAIDSITGNVVGLDNLPPNKVAARLMTPGPRGERFIVLDRVDLKHVGDLPRNIIPKKKGYLPRPYKYPAYVKRFKDGVAVETVRPARSVLEGEGLVEDLRASTPGEDFRVVQAQEFRDAENLDEMAALEDAGLLFSSVRGSSRQLDASGSVRITTVEDRIRKMISDGAMSAGLSKWGDAQRIAWQSKWGKMFDGQWALGQPTGQLAPKSVANAADVQQAKHEAEFINNVMGVGQGAVARTVKAIGTDLANRLYNTATRLDRLTGSKKGNLVTNALRDIGDNLIGASGRILANAKTLPYLLFLAGNPLRQFPLQLTLIPSYFGVRGAGKYALGGFQRDFSILLANGLTEQGSKLVGKLGSDADLVDQFRRSGLMASLEHHTQVATIGTTGTTSRATRFGNAVDSTTKALTNVGIGAGIKTEKVAGWLISRNRWKTLNPGKKIDEVAEQEIAAFAEELSLNPNRGDTLPINHGILGLFTQFLSMQVKQIGRTFQALPGVSSGQLTKREAAQMALVNLSVYGVTGYGAKELAATILNDPAFEGVSDDVRELVADGISNYVLDTVLEAATNEESDTAFSEAFSPNAQLGGSIKLVANLKDMFLFGDWSSLAEARWQAPALGLTKQVAETVGFMASVYGAPPLPTPESDTIKLAAVTKKAMSVMPALNNWMKMQAAMELKAKFNGRGDPLVEASLGEALAAVIGVKTKEEVQLWELNNLVNSSNLESGDILPNIRDQAYETSKWMLPLLDQMVDGKVTHIEAMKYIDLHNAFFFSTLPEEYHLEYVTALRDIVDKRWTPRYDALLQRVLDSAGTGKLPVTADAIEAIATRIPDPAKRQEAVDALKSKLFGAE